MTRTATNNETEPLVVSVNNALRLLACSRTSLYRKFQLGCEYFSRTSLAKQASRLLGDALANLCNMRRI
jgi:hypothetical protein